MRHIRKTREIISKLIQLPVKEEADHLLEKECGRIVHAVIKKIRMTLLYSRVIYLVIYIRGLRWAN